MGVENIIQLEKKEMGKVRLNILCPIEVVPTISQPEKKCPFVWPRDIK